MDIIKFRERVSTIKEQMANKIIQAYVMLKNECNEDEFLTFKISDFSEVENIKKYAFNQLQKYPELLNLTSYKQLNPQFFKKDNISFCRITNIYKDFDKYDEIEKVFERSFTIKEMENMTDKDILSEILKYYLHILMYTEIVYILK